MDLDTVTVLNRCQEFTVFVRNQSLGDLRFNERMGVGAQTPWGADEGPDFLIRLVKTGCRLVYFPRLFVYHPNKTATISRSTLDRGASYARGRGCLFRLHRFPRWMIFNSLFRSAAGCGLYLLRCQPMRSAYYFTIVRGTLRGLLMSRAELAAVRENTLVAPASIQPISLPPLPPQPLVSVLIANYNYARFLPAALDSLLAQTYRNWQAVVCDDGSTDDSVKIVNSYVSRDARIQLVEKSNGGQTSTVNACYQHLRGEILCLLDADDVFDPCKIQRVVETFATDPRAGTCNHFTLVIDANGRAQPVTLNHHLDSGWLANDALQRGACVDVPTTSCMSMRREIARLVFPIPERQSRDVDGYLGMVTQFLAPVALIHEALSGYRIHGNNMGGLTEPTPERLRYELHLIELRTANVKQFVGDRLGSGIARRIVIEDNPQYIQAALKLLAIEKADRRLSRAVALIRRHPNAKWRAIWRTIFAAPGPLSRLAIPMMHRSHRAKALVHRLMDRGKGVTA
jgi:glycosyltransferase involved in cell wall biosynthesis